MLKSILLFLIISFWILPSLASASFSSYSTSYEIRAIERETEKMKACLRSENAHWDFWYDMCTCNDWYSRFYDDLEATYNIAITCIPKKDQEYVKIDWVNKEKAFVGFSLILQTWVYVANITSATWTLRRGCKNVFMEQDKTYSFVQYLWRGYITDPVWWYCELSDIDEVSRYIPTLRTKTRREILNTTRGIRDKASKKEKLQILLEKYVKDMEVIGKATQLWQSAFKKSLIEKEIGRLK